MLPVIPALITGNICNITEKLKKSNQKIKEAISKVFKNGRKFLLRSANGAFSVVTLWVATENYHFQLINNLFSAKFCRTFEITS